MSAASGSTGTIESDLSRLSFENGEPTGPPFFYGSGA